MTCSDCKSCCELWKLAEGTLSFLDEVHQELPNSFLPESRLFLFRHFSNIFSAFRVNLKRLERITWEQASRWLADEDAKGEKGLLKYATLCISQTEGIFPMSVDPSAQRFDGLSIELK